MSQIQDHAEIDPAQSHALVQGSEDEIARQQTPSMNTMAIQQQQREYEKMYGGPDPGLNGMNMGFNPMTNGEHLVWMIAAPRLIIKVIQWGL